MTISANTRVQDVFNQFNQLFPFLRLEFYKTPHQDNEGSEIRDQISHETLLGSLNPKLVDKSFVVNPEMTVAEFEKMMSDEFGLNVQVFRKSAGIWLQTTATDGWSLEKQNGKGERSTKDYDIKPVEMKDLDLE
jgi:hypothetical protein